MLRRLEGEPGSRKPRRTFVVVGVVLLIPAVAALVLLLLWNM